MFSFFKNLFAGLSVQYVERVKENPAGDKKINNCTNCVASQNCILKDSNFVNCIAMQEKIQQK
jgi:hypothetical protein